MGQPTERMWKVLQTAYIDPKLDKCLANLRRSGKKAGLAAERADQMIARLRAGIFLPEQVASATKHGELRIKGCIKYDLGGGYRLVTLKESHRIYLLYIGSHDECHRWIENNRDLPLDLIKERSQAIALKSDINRQDENQPENISEKVESEMDESEIFYEDSQLRRIFSGLTGSQE
jgi:hypothetical protein